jgi:drug/metabolite transporter (DMT)-like permease
LRNTVGYNRPVSAPVSHSGVVKALAAAALFGASTPLAKLLVGAVSPVLLAGLLYLGSGIGLLAWFLWRRLRADHPAREAALTRRDLPWLAGAILSGGVLGPALLMFGLAHTPAASASLLLNLEGVFTAGLAWFVFKENFDRRIALGMASIVAGGVLLSWPEETGGSASLWTLAIAGACFAWAIDNNLTRRISAGDPVQIAGLKGLVAGLVNTGIALAMGHAFPGTAVTMAAGVVGLFGYGLSLVLFVLALRHLGSARTGAYFSTAPFIGVVFSLILLSETPGPLFWAAAGLMAVGVWLHLTERHEHEHGHESIAHTHTHVYDEHHRHAHDFPWDGAGPHGHVHAHPVLTHKHPHYPDIHHRHRH